MVIVEVVQGFRGVLYMGLMGGTLPNRNEVAIINICGTCGMCPECMSSFVSGSACNKPPVVGDHNIKTMSLFSVPRRLTQISTQTAATQSFCLLVMQP